MYRKQDNGEAKLYRQPFNWATIANGLEQECSKALNAVPLRSVVSVRYSPKGQAVLLVDGKFSNALNTLAMFKDVDYVLELLSTNGRAVTTYRESGEGSF